MAASKWMLRALSQQLIWRDKLQGMQREKERELFQSAVDCGMPARCAWHVFGRLPRKFSLANEVDMCIRANAWRGVMEFSQVHLDFAHGRFSLDCSHTYHDDYGGSTTTAVSASGTFQVRWDTSTGVCIDATCTEGERTLEECGYPPEVQQKLAGLHFSWLIRGLGLELQGADLRGVPKRMRGRILA